MRRAARERRETKGWAAGERREEKGGGRRAGVAAGEGLWHSAREGAY
jgi:hypothetical protein